MDNIPTAQTGSFEVIADGILSRLDAADAAGVLGRDGPYLRNTTRLVRDRVEETRTRLEQIQNDDYLSEEGKQAKAADLLAATRDAVTARIESATDTVRSAMRRHQLPALKAPVRDEALLEAKLSNARSDANLALSGVTAAGDAIAVLTGLAGQSDILRYLVLSSDYPLATLKRLGASPGMIDQWRATHARLLVEAADPDDVAKYEAAQGLRHLPRLFDALAAGTVGAPDPKSSLEKAFTAQGSQR